MNCTWATRGSEGVVLVELLPVENPWEPRSDLASSLRPDGQGGEGGGRI